MCLKMNGERTEWRKKSRQREKKVRAILQEKAIVIDFEIKQTGNLPNETASQKHKRE